MSGLLLLASMGLEARALRRGAPDAHVQVTGIGPRRARRAAARVAGVHASGVAVAGFGGALDSELEPGDVVVASELHRRDGSVVTRCVGAGIIAGMLGRQGLRVHVGPVVSVRRPVMGAERGMLRRNANALLADMESAWLSPAAHGRPFVTARVVVDTPDSELWNPLAIAAGFARASRSLSSVGGALAEWASVIAPQSASPAPRRCSGHDRPAGRSGAAGGGPENPVRAAEGSEGLK
jgi:4-hydroxy-3-methylbut-2-en-1-yl diphosphate reductase